MARLFAILVGAALLVSVVAGCSNEASQEPVTLRLGYETAPPHPYGLVLDEFAARVRKLTGGSVVVQNIPEYPRPLVPDVRSGTIDLANVTTVFWHDAGVKSFDALQMPFLVDRYDVDRQVLNGPIGRSMLDGVSSFGLVGLGFEESGLRRPLAVSRRLSGPANYRGLRWRTPVVLGPPTEANASGTHVPTVMAAGQRALGMTPVAVPTDGLYNALASRFVTALDVNLPTAAGLRLGEVTRFATANVAFWPFAGVLVMNSARFASLNADQQAAVREAAARMADSSLAILRKYNPSLDRQMCKAGVRFVMATAADQRALRAAVEGVYARFERDAATALLIHEIEQLRASFPPGASVEPVSAGCVA